ncbi:MAG: hypothetical protein RIR12_2459 [Bacteroidota bacterium]|jgi:hypothetical protein
MKKALLLVCFIVSVQVVTLAQSLNYYLPTAVTYRSTIPKPADIIDHEVGQWHITHDRLVNYMKSMAAAAPDRMKLEVMGYTYEQRPQVLLIITSPSNHKRLEEIRQQHLLLSDPATSSTVNTATMPLVVWIGHSIHGNEASGANASLLSAYYLAAAEGKQIEELLEHTVILFDPSFNPDGLQRFATWANQHKSKNLVSDPNSREFNEVWPGGRFNHYWFDLNRDWLPAVHPESKNRLKWYHRWKPNILTDHHEQGSNATFFFQPGVPSRVNPLTPDKNQALTAKLGTYHAKYLDSIGSLYFTKENYDDFYYGKGSTYPDINGAIGILFEQASSRGHLQQTANGLLSFPATIRNQFVTTLSTLFGAHHLRKEFLDWQREFYKQAILPTLSPIGGYVYGDKYDVNRTQMLTDILLQHQIEVHELGDQYNGDLFEKGKAFAVSLNQPQRMLIKAIFENVPAYKDSLFYDITAWNLPLAMGLPHSSYPQTAKSMLGKKINQSAFASAKMPTSISQIGYFIEWSDFYAPAALFELQQQNILVKTVSNPLEISINGEVQQFSYGSLLVPVSMQIKTAAEIYASVQAVTAKYGLRSYAITNGSAIRGSDVGSSKMLPLTKPSIALITGTGVNALDAGEVWHLLDQRMNIPITQLESSIFNRVELQKYNTIIMVGGQYNDLNKEKLRAWVQAGGVLILTEEAVSWAAANGINDVKIKRIKPAVDSSQRIAYIEREQLEGAQQMNGAIFGAQVDLTHPLAYGYHSQTVSLFKANKVFMEKSRSPYATPFYYGQLPLQSGWISKENAEAIKNSAAVLVNVVGNGRIINIADNPNLRGFWLGGTKLLMNAIFFGRNIEASSARSDE